MDLKRALKEKKRKRKPELSFSVSSPKAQFSLVDTLLSFLFMYLFCPLGQCFRPDDNPFHEARHPAQRC
jgi:hypothetical protein